MSTMTANGQTGSGVSHAAAVKRFCKIVAGLVLMAGAAGSAVVVKTVAFLPYVFR